MCKREGNVPSLWRVANRKRNVSLTQIVADRVDNAKVNSLPTLEERLIPIEDNAWPWQSPANQEHICTSDDVLGATGYPLSFEAFSKITVIVRQALYKGPHSLACRCFLLLDRKEIYCVNVAASVTAAVWLSSGRQMK
uniref:Uncharacterized protein n=1 Tax=Glossina austeni TaxID=7395 RepID=A0A1A9VUB3_GLOAU